MKHNKGLILILTLTLFIIFVGPSLGIDVGVGADLYKPLKITIEVVTRDGPRSISYGLSSQKLLAILWVYAINAIIPPDDIEIGSPDTDIDENNNDAWEEADYDECFLSCLIGIGGAIHFCSRVLRRLFC